MPFIADRWAKWGYRHFYFPPFIFLDTWYDFPFDGFLPSGAGCIGVPNSGERIWGVCIKEIPAKMKSSVLCCIFCSIFLVDFVYSAGKLNWSVFRVSVFHWTINRFTNYPWACSFLIGHLIIQGLFRRIVNINPFQVG